MGIRKWFSGKKTKTAMSSPTFQDLAAFAERRERAYDKLFGGKPTVSHELVVMMPHIDVYIYPPQAKRQFYTLVSSGMSDLPMELDEGVDRSYRRCEIILYCDAPEEAYINMVRYFARFPFENSTWLGPGHSVPYGEPPQPMFENSELVATVLTYPILKTDVEWKLVLGGDPVRFLWPVPITEAELDLKLNRGYNALMELFNEVEHPYILNPGRASYV